jgi:hypothetical protein
MQDLDCMYGFISNYEETIFLRQQHINGTWEVEYSPIIDPTTSHVPSDPSNPLVSPIFSARQSFFYLASLAAAQGPVMNRAQWVVAP